MRHGVGICTWADGSYYRGDWTQNRRHGKGCYLMFDGTKYEGSWVNDVKHGSGRLTYPDGETICGTWQNDRINGIAIRRKKDGKDENVIFKNDMLIMSNDTGVDCCDIVYLIFSLIFCCGFWSAIPLALLIHEGFFGLFGCLVPYVIWSCCHPTSRYVKNLRTLKETQTNV